MHSRPGDVCQRCNGRGTLPFYQLSDYLDCPDCNGTGFIQPQRFRWPSFAWVRPLGKAVWSWTKVLALPALFIGVVAGTTLASRIEQEKHIAVCVSAGGHFAGQPFGADECWAADGTHRIFPEGF